MSVSFLPIIFNNCLFQFAHAHLLALSYNLHYHYALRSCRHRYGIGSGSCLVGYHSVGQIQTHVVVRLKSHNAYAVGCHTAHIDS